MSKQEHVTALCIGFENIGNSGGGGIMMLLKEAVPFLRAKGAMGERLASFQVCRRFFLCEIKAVNIKNYMAKKKYFHFQRWWEQEYHWQVQRRDTRGGRSLNGFRKWEGWKLLEFREVGRSRGKEKPAQLLLSLLIFYPCFLPTPGARAGISCTFHCQLAAVPCSAGAQQKNWCCSLSCSNQAGVKVHQTS